jgi:hypothetical protein
MKSTSAADRGGRLALVEGGSVLVGIPGAPGCTTEGFAGAVCREPAAGSKVKEQNITTKAIRRLAMPREKPNFRSQRKRNRLKGVEWESFIGQSTKHCHKTVDCSKLSRLYWLYQFS